MESKSPHKEGWAFMRSSAQGSLATVLLLIPILAVPMLAIFGVPQLAPTVSSPYAESAASKKKDESEAPPFSPKNNGRDPFDQIASHVADEVPEWGEDPADTAARALADRRQTPPVPERRLRESAPVEATESSPFAMVSDGNTAMPMADMAAGSYRRTRPAADENRPQPRRPSARTVVTVADPQLTWRDAVQKLNALEIRNFRLEPGQQPLQFLFSCSYTPRDNPRVSRRFEAEADEPLLAVEHVLEQIDTWRAAR